jgi:hypothetical protein
VRWSGKSSDKKFIDEGADEIAKITAAGLLKMKSIA